MDRGQRLADESGLTLLEVLAAIFILSIALFALAGTAIPSLSSLRETRERELATNAASSAIEETRAFDFRATAMAPGTDLTSLPDVVRDALDVSGPLCAGTEPVVTDGAVSEPVELVSERVGTEVYTVVTWADEVCGTAGSALKRVSAVALWTEGARTSTVVQSTLIAPAGRGLPVPDFRLTPPAQTVVWSSAQIAAGVEQCAEHHLRNLGADDRYDFAIVGADDEPTTDPLLELTKFRFASTQWEVRGYLEVPASGTLRNGVPPDNDDNLMRDSDSNFRPDTGSEPAVIVPSGQTASLTFCYQPRSDAAPLTVRIGVFSRFDERRYEVVEHTLAVQEPGIELFLQDRDDSGPHTRGVKISNNQVAYPAYAMRPLNTETDDRIQNLGTTLYNWSVEVGNTQANIDVAGTPDLEGNRIRRQSLETGNPDSHLRRLDWRYQFSGPTQMLPNATLTLWVAPVSALTNTLDPDNPPTVSLQVHLDGLNASEQTGPGQLVWDGVTAPVTYQHTTNDWEQITVPITFGTAVNFQSDQRLRLRVTCGSTSTEDCNLAYDTVDFPSRLEVRLQ